MDLSHVNMCNSPEERSRNTLTENKVKKMEL